MPSLSKQEAAILEAARAYAKARKRYVESKDRVTGFHELVQTGEMLKRAAEKYGL